MGSDYLENPDSVSAGVGKTNRVRGVKGRTQAWLNWVGQILGNPKCLALYSAAQSPEIIAIRAGSEDVCGSGDLFSLVQQSLKLGRYCYQTEKARQLIAYPLIKNGRPSVILAIELSESSQFSEKKTLEQLRWGGMAYWGLKGSKSEAQGLAKVLDLTAIVLENRNFKVAATAFVTELALRTGSDRVSLGFLKKGRSSVQALSHSARFSDRTNLSVELESAMDEALDQRQIIILPVSENTPEGTVVIAHQHILDREESRWICTMPLAAEGVLEGALVLECGRPDGLTESDRTLVQHIVTLVFPILLMKKREEQTIGKRFQNAFRDLLLRFFGPGYLLFKLISVIVITLLASTFLIHGDYHVTADTSVEAKSLRIIVAPQSGFIKQAKYRAGDFIGKGDFLATLDDRDLKLERIKWFGQREQLRKEHRGALAERDRTQVNIINAQIAQAEAQLALVDEKLARILIDSPIDGHVVNGDLSQSLGAPVERGDVLFEVASRNNYRAVLNVDERDIAEIAVGQQGRLSLNSLPDSDFDFEIAKITPVSKAAAGINSFRVEADLKQKPQALRPGMTGIGKIEIGSRSLLWIWTHRFSDWLRMQLWSWWG